MAELEYLVVLDESAKPAAEKLEHLRALVRQEFSDRVVVVGPEDGEVALRKLSHVEAVVSSDEPNAVYRLLADLTSSERLQVEAWRDRKLGSTSDDEGKRPGDGRAWDDPDFEPPDPPWARHV